LNERHVSAELALRWGPDIVGQIEQLKKRLASVQVDRTIALEEKGEHPEWRNSALRRAKSYPDLLVVRSVPLVTRMLSTVTQKVNEKAAQAKDKEVEVDGQ